MIFRYTLIDFLLFIGFTYAAEQNMTDYIISTAYSTLPPVTTTIPVPTQTETNYNANKTWSASNYIMVGILSGLALISFISAVALSVKKSRKRYSTFYLPAGRPIFRNSLKDENQFEKNRTIHSENTHHSRLTISPLQKLNKVRNPTAHAQSLTTVRESFHSDFYEPAMTRKTSSKSTVQDFENSIDDYI
jgi:hypothetical protein